jgi:CRP-like cAMP-binding protein
MGKMKTESHFYSVNSFEGAEREAVGVLPIIPPSASRADELTINGNGFSRKIPFDGLLTNKLLTALPGQDLARLLSYFESVSLEAGRNVYELGEEVNFVYFPETAIVSNFHSLEDGTTTEAAVIGNEGLVGVSAILDSRAPSYWTQVTIGGSAVRCSREIIKQEFVRSSAMQEVLLKYMNVLLSQLSQRAVCNGSHHLDRRLSTWLLMIHDRANGDPLSLTHEQIAEHLGTRRAGITGVCNSLRSSGAIRYSRGQMTILDRSILETAACECYETLRL